MKTTTRFLVLTIVIANTVALAQQFDPFESYLEEFVSALDLPVLPAGTNSPAWTVPDKVVFRATVWTIHDVSGAVPRIAHLYRLTCGNGETNIPFRAYPTLSEENASRIVGWALGGPASLPADHLASCYSVS